MASRKGTTSRRTVSSALRMHRERARAGNPRSAWVACRKRPTHKSLVILSGVRHGGRSRRTCGCSCLCISRDRTRTGRPVFLFPVPHSLLLRRAQSHARTQSLIPAPFARAKVTTSRHLGTNTLELAGKMRSFWNRVSELISNAIPEAIGRLSPPFRGRVLELRRPWI